MKRLLVVLGAPIFFVAPLALAQEVGAPSYFNQPVKAPSNALELTVATGYTQGFGDLRGTAGYGMGDVMGAGLGTNASVGYRLNPRWHLSVMGEYQEFYAGPRESGGEARGTAFTVNASYHVLPYNRVDPWVQLGSGYRLLWEVPNAQPTTLSHGFDFLRAMVGVDIRTTPDVNVGPMIGADVSTFLWQQTGSQSGIAINDPRVSTFLYGGIQGRFDLAGSRESEPKATIAAQ